MLDIGWVPGETGVWVRQCPRDGSRGNKQSPLYFCLSHKQSLSHWRAQMGQKKEMVALNGEK